MDVDLAFVGLSEMEKAFVSDYAGTFAFKVQTLRVPPMSDGWVRIQACEVCCDGDLVDTEERLELQVGARDGATDDLKPATRNRLSGKNSKA